jgi:plastocyanin
VKSTRYALAAGAVAASLVAAAPATAATRLVATVGPGTNISLTKAGKRVTILRPGVYTITVRDRSRFHNFHLRGPRVNRATTVAQVRTVTWTLRLRKGKHTFVCDPHALSMRGSFTVR